MESVHQLMLDDEIPENERKRLDPDHWYEINLTNATLFSNLVRIPAYFSSNNVECW